MSRSKHTDPTSIRSERRLRAPREPRGAGDTSRVRKQRRILKEVGVIAGPEQTQPLERPPVRPRIITQRPQSGFHHPANKQQILELLNAVGPIALYGLRSITLVRCEDVPRGPILNFAKYQVPGKIVLYEQPLPPWRLPGLLTEAARQQLERAGASLSELSGATLVDWPKDALRRFMLEEVLLHEIGHHVLQHHKGKRPARIARTRDHEAFATRFAERQRAAFAKRRQPQA